MEDSTPAQSERDALMETEEAQAVYMQETEASDGEKHMRQLYAAGTRMAKQIKFVERKLELLEDKRESEDSLTKIIREDLQVYDTKKAEKERLIAKLKSKLSESALRPYMRRDQRQQVDEPVTTEQIFDVIKFIENELELMQSPDILAHNDMIRKVIFFYDTKKSENAILEAELKQKLADLRNKYSENARLILRLK